ncbi:SAM dependent carboxyl methyltransferase [Dillenia turbinata]|uniref:SAM dependent carboxyl methyltransferase n=1 Tax=Dillenia turbinata TaxID=194707 RepID=A0AAN8Z200_9MAGN
MQKSNVLVEALNMNGGDGPYSYAENSSYQRGAVETAEEIISRDIASKFDTKQLSSISPSPICIADFGCASGSNSLIAVHGIVEAIEAKLRSQGIDSKIIEFQVFFNDLVTNDFNMLLTSLPSERRYYAAAVPGSFHGILFPRTSLHFAYSSCALHWMSKLPDEVTDEGSPAWNNGRIFYIGAPNEVLEAYSSQFAKDMDSFLSARAHELVSGGLMALIVPAFPDGVLSLQTTNATEIQLLESCLVDMAKIGIVSEVEVDSFNLPAYYTSPKELKIVIEKNGDFTIERLETLKNPKRHIAMPNLRARTMFWRALIEGMIDKHFGEGVADELFNRYSTKAAQCSLFMSPERPSSVMLIAVLKRKDYLLGKK